MTAPKSFEWRGYRFEATTHERLGDCWAVFRPGRLVAFAIAEDFEQAKKLCRESAAENLYAAQAEFDRVMEAE